MARKRKAKEVASPQEVTKQPLPEVQEDTKVLDQHVKLADGSTTSILTFIDKDKDIYTIEKKRKEDGKMITDTKYIMRRDAIKRIADAAGLSSSKTLVIAPSIDNNQLTAFDVTVVDTTGKSTTMLGEASNENTRGVSRQYKALTAERRGFVRAVLNHLSITGIYGEDEFVEDADEVELPESETPSREEFESIAPFINKILNAGSKEALQEVGEAIKADASTLSDREMKYLRELYKKNLLKFEEGI